MDPVKVLFTIVLLLFTLAVILTLYARSVREELSGREDAYQRMLDKERQLDRRLTDALCEIRKLERALRENEIELARAREKLFRNGQSVMLLQSYVDSLKFCGEPENADK